MTTAVNESLNNIRVVQLGSSRAVKLAGMILRDCGADVLSVVSGKTEESDAVFERSKNRITLQEINDDDKFIQLLKRTDILLEDGISDKLLKKVESRIASQNHLIRCCFPAQSDSGNLALNEDAVSAMNGLYEDISGLSKPRPFPLSLVSTVAAFHAVNAITMALIGRERTSKGYSICIPLEKTTLSIQVLVLMERSRPPSKWEPIRWLASPFMGVYKAADNRYIYVQIGMPRHLRSFLFLIESKGFKKEKEKLKELLSKDTRRDPISNIGFREALKVTSVLRSLFIKKRADYWEQILGEGGLCCTQIRSFDEWIAHPQVLQSQEVVSFGRRDGSSIKIPGRLMDTSGENGVSLHEGKDVSLETLFQTWNEKEYDQQGHIESQLPLDKIRVLDLSRIIAGPFSGRILAEYGADVVQLSLRGKHLLWEEPFHIAFNAGKRSVAVDCSKPGGREKLDKLIGQFKPDIVVHNFLDKAAVKLGIDYESMKKRFPEIIHVSIKGYNPSGPWSSRPGFEQNVQAVSGILHTYNGNSTVPRIIPIPIIDLSTGLISSFSAALGFFGRLRGKGGRQFTTNLTVPAIYLQMDSLNSVNKKNMPVSGYYQSRDCLFYLSVKPAEEPYLFSIPEIKRDLCGKLEPVKLKKVFKKHAFSFWQNRIQELKLDQSVQIVKRCSVGKILKADLAEKGGIFSYREHEGIGRVLAFNSPVQMEPHGVREISTAEPIGKSTYKYISNGAAIKREMAVVNKNENFFHHVKWFLSQCRWLAVIAWREFNLRR